MLRYLLLLCAVVVLSVRANTYGDGDVHAEFHIECSDTGMWVFFNKTRLDSRTISGYTNRQYNIYFKDTTDLECRTNKNDTNNHGDPKGFTSGFNDSIWLNANYSNGCGLSEYVTSKHIVYNQTITIKYGLNPVPDVRREEFDHYYVKCVRPHTVNTKIDGGYINVTRKIPYQPPRNATGEFSFNFGHTNVNGTEQSEYLLGDDIKFTLALDSVSTVKNVIQECWSSNNGSDRVAQAIFRNRCPVDSGTKLLDANNTKTVFTVEAYRALGLSTQMIFVTCAVRICVPSSTSPECLHCNETVTNRRRRDTGSTLSSGKMATIKTSVGFFIKGNDEPVVVVIKNPDSTIKNPTQGQQEDDDETSFVEGPGGIALIVIMSALLFGVIVAVAYSYLFASSATLVAKGPATSAFVNQGIEY